MGTCGCCDDTGGGGECTDALKPIRCCRPVYQGAEANDTVRGPDLQKIIDELVAGHNNQAAALSKIMREDCTLADGIVRCRNLHPEVGQACLVDGQVIPPIPPPPGPLPGGPVLDYPGLNTAYGGWSLRLLTTAYSGPLIQVRRSLDNALQDIYPDASGLVDTAAMIAFAAGTDLFVQTIYEQVGQVAAHDLIQTTPAQQPKIYDSITGFETNDSGRICCYFDDIDDFMAGPNTDLRYTTEMLASIAFEWHTEANGDLVGIHDEQSVFNAWDINYRRPSGSSQYFQPEVTGQGGNISVTGRLNEPFLLSLGCLETGSPITVTGRLNGSLRATDSSGGFTTNSTGRLYLGNNAGLSSFGAVRFQELVYFVDIDWAALLPDLAEALRTVLDENMMATWGITPD